MATSRKILREEIKADFLKKVSDFLTESGEEVLRTASNRVAIPVVDKEGNEDFLELTFKIPTGSRDGDAYDGYSEADSYEINQRVKAEKEEKKKKEKEKKIAQDKKRREQQEKIKAEKAEREKAKNAI